MMGNNEHVSNEITIDECDRLQNDVTDTSRIHDSTN